MIRNIEQAFNDKELAIKEKDEARHIVRKVALEAFDLPWCCWACPASRHQDTTVLCQRCVQAKILNILRVVVFGYRRGRNIRRACNWSVNTSSTSWSCEYDAIQYIA
jgi:hypothetical protein